MIALLSKIFIKDRENYKDENVRRAYGTLCSLFGIFLNVLLFAGKFIAGTLTGSIAITADSFNNLSDAGSSVITLVGFRLSAQKPDLSHPFGHGRFEYLSGLFVSVAILLMGFSLARDSINKIIHPEAVSYSILSIVILAVSVLVKVYMAMYNGSYGKKISSTSMKATAADSLSDAVSTAVVLCIAIIGRLVSGLKIDGWAGLLVALFIFWNGIKAVRETIAPLLGQMPEEEFVKDIENIVLAHTEISGIHDLVVHDYGPGRQMISLHAEVPMSMDILVAHDVIDLIERELGENLSCHATIHMDPINTDDEFVTEMRKKVSEIAKKYDERITVHDFRCVSGNTHTNLIFDVVLPFDYKTDETEFKNIFAEDVKKIDSKYLCVITVDRAYTK